MSRIGRMPITVPAGVTVNVAEGNVVTVKGPKGELTKALRPEMILKQEGSTITVERPSDDKLHRSLHGLTRTLLHNMIVGVTDGYKKELEVNGVGYRVAKEGKNLVMNLGFSHQVIVSEIEGITIDAARVPAAGNIHLRRIALYINKYCAYNNNAQSYSLRIHQKLRLLYHIS